MMNDGSWLQYVDDVTGAIIGFLSTAALAMWKLFSLNKNQALLEQRILQLEKTQTDHKDSLNRVEEKITETLIRIENKLDNYITKHSG